MMKILIYGHESSKFEYLKMLIQKFTKDVNIEFELEEIRDTAVFIEKGIQSIPAVEIDGVVKGSDGLDFERFCYSVGQWILGLNNFGNRERIVVPIDFSETSENALIYATQLARESNRFVKVLHVMEESFESIDGLYSNHTPEILIFKEKLNRYIDKFIKSLLPNELLYVDPKALLLQGPIHNSIITEVEDNDWIVMGNVGISSLSRGLFGSTSSEIAHKSHCPVFIIPQGTNYLGFQKILLHNCTGKEHDQFAYSVKEMFAKDESSVQIFNSRDFLDITSSQFSANRFYHDIAWNKFQSEYDQLLETVDENDIQLIVVKRLQLKWFKNIIERVELNRAVSKTHIPLLFIN